ncbi:MAG TPA: hypothetical protein VLF91_05175 [Candidatus Saccharimonadales bacterium]|nr:hypothetical protein [Candidatus Saccharimonadales bacterium]
MQPQINQATFYKQVYKWIGLASVGLLVLVMSIVYLAASANAIHHVHQQLGTYNHAGAAAIVAVGVTVLCLAVSWIVYCFCRLSKIQPPAKSPSAQQRSNK